MNPMTRRAHPAPNVSADSRETSKGKTTETCVAEGAMSICPACFKDLPSHWSFDPLLDVTE